MHDYAGHPFQVELSRELAKRGHDVLHLYYGNNNTPKGNLTPDETDAALLAIKGIFTKRPIQKYSYLKRWLQDLEYGRIMAERIHQFAPDVLISANTPLDSLRRIITACKMQDTKFVFWLQDVSGLAAYKLLRQRIPIVGGVIGKYHIHLERRMLRNSDGVVLIADEFKPFVEGWGVQPEVTCVIHNWAPLDEVPVGEKSNPWAIEHEVSDKFCILYTGGLGMKHNPNLILQLAIAFHEINDVCITVVSEGLGSSWLQKRKTALGLTNLKLLDYQPFELMPEVLAAGDMLVAILEQDAGGFSVPSKVLTYLCAERPLLLAVPADNLASKIVMQNEAGVVVDPGDVDAFVNAAKKLQNDSHLRDKYAHNARVYAEKHFNIRNIGDQFEEFFLRIRDS